MKFKKILFYLCLFCVGVVEAQEPNRFTMFDMAPLSMNPANAGRFEGSFRVGGIYRSQWAGLNIGTGGSSDFAGFKTLSAYVDAPLPFRLGKHWLGAGLEIFNDQTGAVKLNTFKAALSLSGHFMLGERGNSRLSVGLKGGLVQQRLVNPEGRTEQDILFNRPIASLNLNNDNTSYADFSGGVYFTHAAQRWGLEAGFAVHHFSQPSYEFLGQSSNLPLLLIGNVLADIYVADRVFLRPVVFFESVAGINDLNGQFLAGLDLNEQRDFKLFGGVGYRFMDAAALIARAGVDIKGLRVGMAYDFPVSGLNTGNPGGFELAAWYIFRIPPAIVVPPKEFCPRI